MRDDLLHQYERELAFLRQTGAEFAKKYPKVASRLLLEPNKSDDPHVERLLEAFAFLAARVHLKVDDDFPEGNSGGGDGHGNDYPYFRLGEMYLNLAEAAFYLGKEDEALDARRADARARELGGLLACSTP